MEGTMQSLPFCVWVISLSRMSCGFIRVIAAIGIAFLFKAEYYSIVSILCINSFVPDTGAASPFWLL
jgi:hypothetical protein